MALTIEPIAALADNYIWLLHDQADGTAAVVDPGEAAPIEAVLETRGWRLSDVFLTHHHGDHTAGAEALRRRYGARITGAAADAHRLPPLDKAVGEGDTVFFAGQSFAIMAVPGHTIGHIAYYGAEAAALFCGDTLFSLGCGRLFEGTAAQMRHSLGRLAALPEGTRVYCGHEYTEANARFAVTIEPDNQALLARQAEVQALRHAGKPTLPSTIATECAANPFLRAGDAQTFAQLRGRKDRF